MRLLSVERDGVMSRRRRGSVPMDQGEVSREGNVGAVFVGEPGPERSDRLCRSSGFHGRGGSPHHGGGRCSPTVCPGLPKRLGEHNTWSS